MKDFDFENKRDRFEQLYGDEQLKLLYMWVKQGVLSLREFKKLLSPIFESEKNGRDWFNNFQDVDNFVFNQLDVDGIITSNSSPAENTIANIKQLMKR